MWRIYSLLHWSGLIVGFSLIATAAFILVFLRCRTNPSVGAIFTIVGVAAAMPSLGARPQVISLLMASVCLWILDRWEHQPNLALLLVPLMLALGKFTCWIRRRIRADSVLFDRTFYCDEFGHRRFVAGNDQVD